jgi:hypothetical protein
MMGRIQLVDFMYERFRKDDVYVHLLGATLPQEFMYYKGYDAIKSIDTSNPILVGASGEEYDDFGMLTKPKDKMEKFFNEDVMPHINLISKNVRTFKQIVNLSK